MRHLFWFRVMATRFSIQKYVFSRIICNKCECRRKILANCIIRSSDISKRKGNKIHNDFSSVDSGKYNGITGTHVLLGSLFGLFYTAKEENKWEGEKELIHKISLAELALKDGDSEKAVEILESALVIADEKSVVVGVACVYDMLATIAYQQGQIARAEDLLTKSIEQLVQMGIPENDNQIVNFSLKLSRIYSHLGEDKLAEMGFKNCIAVQKPKVYSGFVDDDETGMLWISILFWYGKFLLNKNRPEEAKVLLEQAYAMSAHVRGILSTQIMVILYYLSEAAFLRKDYDNTLRYLLNALILGKESNNPDLPLYYVRVGIVYLHKGMPDYARLWCENGKKYAKLRKNKEAEEEANDCLRKLAELTVK